MSDRVNGSRSKKAPVWYVGKCTEMEILCVIRSLYNEEKPVFTIAVSQILYLRLP